MEHLLCLVLCPTHAVGEQTHCRAVPVWGGTPLSGAVAFPSPPPLSQASMALFGGGRRQCQLKSSPSPSCEVQFLQGLHIPSNTPLGCTQAYVHTQLPVTLQLPPWGHWCRGCCLIHSIMVPVATCAGIPSLGVLVQVNCWETPRNTSAVGPLYLAWWLPISLWLCDPSSFSKPVVPLDPMEYNPSKSSYHPIQDACWGHGQR